MREKKNPSSADMAALEAEVDKYRALCVQMLKEIDQAHKVNGSFPPYHSTTSLGMLLDYLPALVADGDLTKSEGKRITTLIHKRLDQGV